SSRSARACHSRSNTKRKHSSRLNISPFGSRLRLGPPLNYCKGRERMKDLVDIAEKIAAVLTERRQTIVVAESSTGGLISATLLAVPGASAYFLGGGVVYTR